MITGPNPFETPKDILLETLTGAIPLWADRLRKRSWDYIQDRAQQCEQYIADHEDEILHRACKEGRIAGSFNRLAEGLACMSFQPGGVRFMGEHWKNQHFCSPVGNCKCREMHNALYALQINCKCKCHE